MHLNLDLRKNIFFFFSLLSFLQTSQKQMQLAIQVSFFFLPFHYTSN